jgi:hypothetical protein
VLPADYTFTAADAGTFTAEAQRSQRKVHLSSANIAKVILKSHSAIMWLLPAHAANPDAAGLPGRSYLCSSLGRDT